jgi:hypothetical protein
MPGSKPGGRYDGEDTHSHSRGALRPSCACIFRPTKGVGATPRGERGMPGARCTRSRACRVVSTRVSHHGRTGTPGIPARDGVNGFLRTLPGDRALLSPSPANNSADLTPTIEASGPHDFAVRKSALSSAAPPASIASQPYVRDDRETPLCVGRDGGGYAGDLRRKGMEIFLQAGLDR